MTFETEIYQDTARSPTDYCSIDEFNSKFNLSSENINHDPNHNISMDSNNSFKPVEQYLSLLHFNIRSISKN